MIKKIKIIFAAILIFVSIFELLSIVGLIKFEPNFAKIQNLSYTILAIITSVICLIREKKQVKEEVRIVYKEAETKEIKDKIVDESRELKENQKILSITNSLIEGIEKQSETAEKLADSVLQRMSKVFKIVQGFFFLWDNEKQLYRTISTYAYFSEDVQKEYEIGEGIVGQVAKNKKFLQMDNVPKDYINVVSGLGQGSPNYLSFLPIIDQGRTIAVIEFATFEQLPSPADKIFDSIAKALRTYVSKFV